MKIQLEYLPEGVDTLEGVKLPTAKVGKDFFSPPHEARGGIGRWVCVLQACVCTTIGEEPTATVRKGSLELRERERERERYVRPLD